MPYILLFIFSPILFIYGWGIWEVAVQMGMKRSGEGIIIQTNPIYDIFQESFAKQERGSRPSLVPRVSGTPGFNQGSEMMTQLPDDK